MRKNINRMHKKREPISLAKARKTKKLQKSIPKAKRLIIFLSTLIAIILGVVIVTRPNAYEVKAGDDIIGIIKNEKILEESLDVVIASLKDKYESEVKVVNEPILKPVHASRKSLVTADYLISQIKKNVQCEIQMVEFLIDGDSIGIFKNKEDVDKLIGKITAKYTPKNKGKIKEAALDAKLDYKNIYVTEDKISDPEKIYEKLTRTEEVEQVYTVASGDNLWGIAEKSDMKVDEIIAINPDLTEQTILQIGDKLNIRIDKPTVSVKIIEEIKMEETIINNIYIDGILQETIKSER